MILKVKSESCSIMSNSLWPHGLYDPWNSPGQNTGVGRFSLLQGVFPTQGSNPGLSNCRRILYQLSHKGSPRILEWVAYPRGSSQSRNQTGVSDIAGRFFTNWEMPKVPWKARQRWPRTTRCMGEMDIDSSLDWHMGLTLWDALEA